MISFKPLAGYLAYHGITYKTLAEKSGLNNASISRIIKTGKFTARTLDKICTALHLKIEDVMRYENTL